MSQTTKSQKILEPRVKGAVNRFVAMISDRYDIERVMVYGSRARGDHRKDSDVDVAVLLRGEPHRFLPVKRDMSGSAFDVMFDTGLLISPLPIWLDEWMHPDTYSNPLLLQNIRNEGVQL